MRSAALAKIKWQLRCERCAGNERSKRNWPSRFDAEPSVGDFIQLMKPRVMTLVILTALAAMLAAPGSLNPVIGTIAMISIAIGAGASGALNMWYDADIDARMARTAARPLPRGRVTPEEALSFGTCSSFGSVLTLGVLVNWTAGALLSADDCVLRLHLHDVAEAENAAQHRHRWCGRCLPADDRLGGGHRQRQPR